MDLREVDPWARNAAERFTLMCKGVSIVTHTFYINAHLDSMKYFGSGVSHWGSYKD